MKNLLDCPIFSGQQQAISDLSMKLQQSSVVQIVTPADLQGILSLIQIEASLLDSGINYRRKILPARRHVAGDELSFPDLEGLIILINPFAEPTSNLSILDEKILINPIFTEFETESSKNLHQGTLDCVAICSSIAEAISPEGARVRKVRPLSISGNWLRQGVEVNYDPVYSLLRDHLNREGTLDVRPIVEVENLADDMIPDLSSRMLKKLAKKWDEMDFDSRSSALSELILPVLRNPKISTMKIEELIWHRLIIPGCAMDIASQLHIALSNWPEDDEKARLHASMIADKLLIEGYF